jgi:pyruvate dehydrogenase E2 component (dihydrolipoamide acetyltransferase)
MAIIIQMPKLSDTMTVGTLVRWLKNEGEALQPGDMLAEVETDKATMEVENFEKGVLLKQYIPEGSQVAVGAAICAIGEAGEAIPASGEAPKACNKDTSTANQCAAPQAATIESDSSVPSVASTPPPQTSCERIKISPLARKLAHEAAIDVSLLSGSGPQGRIVKADIMAYQETPKKPVLPAASSLPVLEGKTLPLSNMRITIARRLLESKTQIPHFYLDMEVNASPLAAFKTSLEQHVTDTKITINDILLKATAKALEAVPAVNVSFMEKAIQQHGSVHLAFGVAVEEGLLTPVIRDAQRKSLLEISLETKALIAKAKSKKLSPQEMTGSTFTVTNLGMFGVYSFLGIINPPNAGILSIGAAQKQAVVNEANQIVVGERMHLGFSGDHRAIDGALAAQFLKKLKALIETPHLILL